MLVLSRKISESIQIGSDVEIVVLQIAGGKVKLGIKAPAHVRLLRGELARTSPLPSSVATSLAASDSQKSETEQCPAINEPGLDFSTEYAVQIEDQMRCAMAV
jgi:carbon storage regulator